MQIIFQTVDRLNNIASAIFPFLAGGFLLTAFLSYSYRILKGYKLSQALLLIVEALLLYTPLIGIAFGLVLYLPKWIPFLKPEGILWAEICAATIIFFRLRQPALKRGLQTAFLHIAILIAGWVADRWLGMLFFSLPLLSIFYHISSQVSETTIPASQPDDAQEKKMRRNIFLSYLWGLQMPLWNISSIDALPQFQDVDENQAATHWLLGLNYCYSHAGVKSRAEMNIVLNLLTRRVPTDSYSAYCRENKQSAMRDKVEQTIKQMFGKDFEDDLPSPTPEKESSGNKNFQSAQRLRILHLPIFS